jgi:hypothetical protein
LRHRLNGAKEKNLTLIAALGLLPAMMLPGGVPITAQSLGIML